MEGMTKVRLDALRLVADGQLEYSKATGSWEPKRGRRLTAFEWLYERHLIDPNYDATPVGRVTQRVPVRVTDEGARVLEKLL